MMGYRIFAADQLFTGTALLGPGHALVSREDGSIEAVIQAGEAGENLRFFSGLLCPGFINTHCHIELSHLKGVIPPGTGLVAFLQKVVRERGFAVELVQEAMAKAMEELWNGGCMAVGDICNTTDSLALKSKSPLRWHSFIEIIGFAAGNAAERLDWGMALLKAFEAQAPRNQASLAPHAPYSVSEALFRKLGRAMQGQRMSVHNQESQAEDDLYRRRSGEMLDFFEQLGISSQDFNASRMSSLLTYLPWLRDAGSLLLVHNTFTQKEDLEALGQISHPPLYWCLCPNANLYIENRLPPVDLLMAHGCTLTLGTDSLASNHQLSMLEEIKALQAHPAAPPLTQLLRMATLNGAQALGLDNELGSFEKGKKPGIVWIKDWEKGEVKRLAASS